MSDIRYLPAGRAVSMAAHPAGKELFSTPRPRKRSRFIIRYDAIITVIVASLVAFCLGMAAQFALDHADPWNGVPACTDQIADAGGICHGEPTSAGVRVTPCATEDSDDCFWLADKMGNGQGRSFVTLAGQTYYQEVTP